MKRLPVYIAIIAISGMLFSCTLKKNYTDEVREISKDVLIMDGNVAPPARVKNKDKDEAQPKVHENFDYASAKKGKLDAAFMVIYSPADSGQTQGAKAAADNMIHNIQGLATDQPDKFSLITSPQEIEKKSKKNIISLALGMTDAAPLEHDIQNVRYFYDKGVRYMGLTHLNTAKMGGPSSDSTKAEGGLSSFGKNLVKEMNRIGMMIDVSGLSDSALVDVVNTTKSPVIASNSSCRYLTPNNKHNLSDSLITKVAQTGGVMMINFSSTAISDSSAVSADTTKARIATWLKEHNMKASDPEAQDHINTTYEEDFYHADIKQVVHQIIHAVNLAGIDHVGFGSTFGTPGNRFPDGLKNASDYPNLIKELLKEGYQKEDIRKLCSGNLLRVWKKVSEEARILSSQSGS